MLSTARLVAGLFAGLLACALPLLATKASASDVLEARLRTIAPSAAVLVVGDEGKIASRNADAAFVPASVAKVVTGWAALEVLGPSYRFETPLYLGPDRTLHVRGAGDPFLVSEELADLAAGLVATVGREPFAALVVDASRHPDGLRVPGIERSVEAYDAPNAALAANFNTIAAVRRGEAVRTAEPQTPLTPLAEELVRERAGQGRSRISLPQDRPGAGPLYAGELIAAFIAAEGGAVAGGVTLGAVPEGLAPVHVHRQSRDLSEIVQAMMRSSNNFIANQLFLELGARDGGPVSLEASRATVRALLADNGLTDGIRLVEGSGIARENRITPEALVGVLELFAPHANLMRRSDGGSRYKTGTFEGVATLAGYARGARGEARFVISTRGGRTRFRLLEAIEAFLNDGPPLPRARLDGTSTIAPATPSVTPAASSPR